MPIICTEQLRFACSMIKTVQTSCGFSGRK